MMVQPLHKQSQGKYDNNTQVDALDLMMTLRPGGKMSHK